MDGSTTARTSGLDRATPNTLLGEKARESIEEVGPFEKESADWGFPSAVPLDPPRRARDFARDIYEGVGGVKRHE